ncbi:NAD(P)-dependent oxidoreductase [Patescibacteria group bacterium AH-259-L07]|nr:NAD(P)-dependent oxidoreductase [Patescibacteria group bacterium AH-259-L07]
MSKTLVITGASGFVGSHALDFALTNELSSYSYVIATDIRELGYVPEYKDKHFTFLKADLTKMNDIDKIMNKIRARKSDEIVVWHMGAIFKYDIPRYILDNVNVFGTKQLLEALSRFDDILKRMRRFVFWSGGIVYGDFNDFHIPLPATETYPAHPTDNYGWSKKDAERLILFFHEQLGVPVTIMRLAAIYGPRSQYGMANALEIVAKGRLAPFIVGKGTNHVALIHAEDVVRTADFLASVDEANGEIYNVVDMTPYTVADVSTFIGKKLDNKPFQKFKLPRLVFKTFMRMTESAAKRTKSEPLVDLEMGKFMLADNWMSNEKLLELAEKYDRRHNLFKYPDSLEGLKQTIEWYRNKGLL